MKIKQNEAKLQRDSKKEKEKDRNTLQKNK
jgi:hypothetical protein